MNSENLVFESKVSSKSNTKIHSRLKFLLKIWHELCVKFDVKYFICYGTLLGQIRHGDIIPWDDDIDICLMDDMIPKVDKFNKYLKKYKMVLQKVAPGYRLVQKNKFKFTNAFMDIAVMSRIPDKPDTILAGYPYVNGKATFHMKTSFPQTFIYNEVYDKNGNCKEVKLGNVITYSPQEDVKIVKEIYGKNCLTHVKANTQAAQLHKTMYFAHLLPKVEKLATKTIGFENFIKIGEKLTNMSVTNYDNK